MAKRITVFLASSITELKEEREKIKSLITDINGKLYHRDITFIVIASEQSNFQFTGLRSQDKLNDELRQCDYCIFLVANSFNPGTKEEFDVASDSFLKYKKPFIQVIFKDIEDNARKPETLEFMKYLRDKGYYYPIYKSSEELTERIINIINEDNDLFKIKNGNVTLDNQILYTIDDNRGVGNNELLLNISNEISEINKKIDAATEDEKESLLRQKNILANKFKTISNKLGEILLKTYSSIGYGYSDEYKNAISYFENGKTNEAETELLFHKSERRNQQKEIIMSCIKNSTSIMNTIIKENELLIDLKKISNDEDNEIDVLYKENIEIEGLMNLEPISSYKYADYLFTHKRYTIAFDYCFKYTAYQYYNVLLDEEKLYNLAKGVIRLGTIYSHLRQFDDAYECYLLASRIHEKLMKEDHRYLLEAADAYNKLGNVSDDLKDYKNGEMYHNKAINIYESIINSADKNLANKALFELAYSYNKQGNIYRHKAIDDNDNKYFKLALDMYNKNDEILKQINDLDKTKEFYSINEKSFGLTYYAMQEYKIASKYFLKSVELHKELYKKNTGLRFPYAKVLYHLSDTMYKLYENGIDVDLFEIMEYLRMNQELLEKEHNNNNNLLEVLFELIRSYELANKIRKNKIYGNLINDLTLELQKLAKTRLPSFFYNK